MKKGFTLIELLVVIAIIGILSSVVLASLNSARAKGGDTAIKSQLAAIRPQAEILYDTYGSYGAAFTGAACSTATTYTLFASTSNQVSSVISLAGGSGNTWCVSSAPGSGQTWAISAILKSANTEAWCVDSTGASKQKTVAANSPTAAITSGVCN